MAWLFESGIPIYRQIVAILSKRICSGEYPVGSEIPSVRELAMEFSVNPNTVQRAFSALSESNIVVTNRTTGRSITTDETLIRELGEKYAREEIERGIRSAVSFGLSKEQIEKIVREVVEND